MSIKSSICQEVDSNLPVQVQTSWDMQKVVSQIYSKWTNPNWFDFHSLSIWHSPMSQSSFSIFLNITWSQPISLTVWALPCLPLRVCHSFVLCSWWAWMTRIYLTGPCFNSHSFDDGPSLEVTSHDKRSVASKEYRPPL